MDGCQVSRLNKKFAEGSDEGSPYACELRWPRKLYERQALRVDSALLRMQGEPRGATRQLS
jgi:hypothetical protein